MKFSLRGLGLFVAWVAIVIALICQIRFELQIPRWTTGVASDVTWIVNLCFTLVVVLVAIATRSSKKMFWIGCAVIAVALFVCQATGQRPRSLARFVSVRLIESMVPAGSTLSSTAKESHVIEMGAVWIYALIPLLSVAGGSFTQWVYQHSGKVED